MPTLLSNTIIAASIAFFASVCAAPAAFATEQSKPAKAKARAKAAAVASADADIAGATATEYSCEQNNKITIYHYDNADSYIALRWKKKIHRLDRVGTSTGALRFENKAVGLIWIGLPTKGMLLDSKQNRQLANECKNAEQSKPATVEAQAPKNG
jgi:membrane-bound inhibitor of C-type lysozyme